MNKLIFGLLVIGVLLLVVSCSAPVQETAAKEIAVAQNEDDSSASVTGVVHTIVIENGQFMPRDLTIKAGDTVEWTNKEATEHTVSFENGEVDEFLPSEGKASYTFMESGEFRFFCKFHQPMQGAIFVN